MKLSLAHLVRIENALKSNLDEYLSADKVRPGAFDRNIQLNREILSLIHEELETRTQVIPA